MSRLVILRVPDPETLEAPEFNYLTSQCVNETRCVFDRVDERLIGEAAQISHLEFDAALLLGPDPVFLGRASIQAMWQTLKDGGAEARPYRLAESCPIQSRSVHTLRGFELLEKVFLENPPPTAVNLPRYPVALLSYRRFMELVENGNFTSARQETPSGNGVAQVGLCHIFTDYYGEVREDIVDFVPGKVHEVLDLGCGRGTTGRFLKERFGCRVTGVELNPIVSREAARYLDRIVQGDLEKVELQSGYDLILALDVVEHLARPEELLARLPGLLKSGGRIILSIPNVGHYAIVEDLIAGRWDYLPIGLLCYTHLRFFTRRTLEDWLQRSGLSRFEIVARKTELPHRFAALPESFMADADSLSTVGFYVLIDHTPRTFSCSGS